MFADIGNNYEIESVNQLWLVLIIKADMLILGTTYVHWKDNTIGFMPQHRLNYCRVRNRHLLYNWIIVSRKFAPDSSGYEVWSPGCGYSLAWRLFVLTCVCGVIFHNLVICWNLTSTLTLQVVTLFFWQPSVNHQTQSFEFCKRLWGNVSTDPYQRHVVFSNLKGRSCFLSVFNYFLFC